MSSVHKNLLLFSTVLLSPVLHYTVLAQKLIKIPITNENWTRPCEPFRMAGNLYYVGTYEMACYLVTTPQGHILINTALDQSVPMIKAHVEKLGFKFSDIKILLVSQAHYDHVGGMATVKKMTGAKLMVQEGDVAVMQDGGYTDYVFGGMGCLFKPVKVDRVLHEHDTVKLGDMKIVALHHPGHTKGSTGFVLDVQDDNRTYRVFIANMPTILDETNLNNMPTYPEVAKDYAYTLDAMKNMQFDIWAAAHASQFHLWDKHKEGDPYNANEFADRKGYDDELANLQKKYDEKVAMHSATRVDKN